jgi:hypothetical protein
VGESTSNLVTCRIGEHINVDDNAVLLGEAGTTCGAVEVVALGTAGGVEAPPLAARFGAESVDGVVEAFFSDFLAELVPLLLDPLVVAVGLLSSPVHKDDLVDRWVADGTRSLDERLGRGR